MTCKSIMAAGLCLLALADAAPTKAVTATADELDLAFKEARRAAEACDAQASLRALRLAMALSLERLPFGVLEVHLLAAPPAGYGQYLPRVDNQYRQNEPITLYMEPVGFKVRHDPKEGTYTYNLTADFNLIDAWGRVLGGRRDFWSFGGASQQFPDRNPLSFTYSLSGLPPDDYRVETTLRDALGNRSHTVVTPFKIVDP